MTEEDIYKNCPYPHCDEMVLHAPGECEHCDHYPAKQKARELMGINYTGHNDPGKEKCPAERRRKVATINLWPGNIPRPKGT